MSNALLLTVALALAAPAPGGGERVQPELAPDKELLAKIEALGENEAILLPKPKIVGEFNEESKKRKHEHNGPGARDFSVKTVWAPDRLRAVLNRLHKFPSYLLV